MRPGVGGEVRDQTEAQPPVHPPSAEKSPPGESLSDLGFRAPTFRSLPAVSGPSEGPAVAALAASAGLVLDPWECDVLNDALGRVGDRWAASKVGLIVPRQNGKGAILSARMLAGLFLFGERLQIATSHEVKSNLETFYRLVALIEDTPELMEQVKAIGRRNGQEQVELKTGARVRFMARSRKSGRSFSAGVIYMDEAYELSPEDVAALVPTVSAGVDPQLWFASTAPDAHSEVLRQIQAAGRSGSDPTLAYAEWCAPDDADPDDPKTIAQANPGLGIRLDLAWILDTERGILTENDFLRERLGISRDSVPGESVIDPEDWKALADETSTLVGELHIAVDSSPRGADAAIAVSGKRRDGLYHVELIDARPKTGWVAARVADLMAKHSDIVRVLVDGRGPVSALIPDLKKAGLDEDQLVVVGSNEMTQACGVFLAATEDDRLRHLPNPTLDDAVSVAGQRNLGDSWAWSRRRSSASIAPLVAATLAVFGVHSYEPPTPHEVFVEWT